MRSWLFGAFALSLLGCGGPDQVEKVLQHIQYDVGGAVVDDDNGQPLTAATVTINGFEGFTQSATTDAWGLWQTTDLAPGVYFVSYEMAGYDTEVSSFSLEAVGENDVANPFVSLGTTSLQTPGAIASIGNPFGVDLEHGVQLVDGQGGAALVYVLGNDGDIVVTFDRAVTGGEVILEDDETGDQLTATVDATNQIFTLPRAAIDQMNATAGLFADADPQTMHQLRLQNFTYMMGSSVRDFDADIWFNCAP